MPYKHFGRIGDVWKHIPLCEFLDIEKPIRYIETNAAYPDYRLTGTPEQEYGILLLERKIAKTSLIKESAYWRAISSLPENSDGIVTYLGSPRLALEILNMNAMEYVFFDIEEAPLRKIERFAQKAGLASSVICRNEDSVEGLAQFADQIDRETFLFVDPYHVHEKNNYGHTYFEGFCRAIHSGAMGMIWYGFNTTIQRHALRKGFSACQTENASVRLAGIEMVSSLISEDPPDRNPGVLGCGILIGNLSSRSCQIFGRLADDTINLYQGSTIFGEYPGDLKCEKYEIAI